MATTDDRETAAARGLLERYGAVYDLPATGPVPVEDIAESLCGLHVRDVPLDPGVSGMLLLQRREIHVNALEAGLWPARRRFTIAHEVGHWELHRDEIEDVTVTRTADYEPAAFEAALERHFVVEARHDLPRRTRWLYACTSRQAAGSGRDA